MNKLKTTLEDRQKGLLLVVAGSGQVTRCAVESGVDGVMALNAGVYRNLGAGSFASFMPYGNANEQAETLLRQQILPNAKRLPVIAGVLAGDPTDDLEARFTRFKSLGIEGITNWPAVSLIDGQFRQILEAEGIGINSEIAMLTQARRHGFATFGFVCEPEVARQFAEAGVECLLLTLGMTRQIEEIHAKRDQLQHSITYLNAMLKAARSARFEPCCVVFGGAVTTLEDLEQLFRHCDVDGFAGGSVFERLPVQEIVSATLRNFKSVGVRLQKAPDESGFGEMIGQSVVMKRLFRLIQRVAPFDVNICLEGESGTGKELVATLIHRLSHRSQQAFVTLNCGAIPDTLVESEFFGHEKGAFTGAHRRRLGKFELANHGTLLLDEIADLSSHAQVALLRAIQQREITRVGGESTIPIDVRIITATHKTLAELVNQGAFRADLYHRLNNLTIQVPALRDHLEDLPVLVNSILERLQIQFSRKLVGLSSRFYDKLKQHAWPGNVRELQHLVSETALLEDGPMLEGHHFQPNNRGEVPLSKLGLGQKRTMTNAEKKVALPQVMREVNGNKSRAAAVLGITRNTLYAWLNEANGE